MTKRILVVEDQEDNRQIIRDLLTSVGYEMIEAHDGEQGVALAAQEKPDLDGCQTWLLFYRQNMHATANDAWRQRSAQHLNNCVTYHRDLSS